MIRRAFAYILIGVGLILLIFFDRYTGTFIKNKGLILGGGLVSLIMGAIILLSRTAREKFIARQYKKRIEGLKKSGEKIKVDLSGCQIKSNDYSVEQDDVGLVDTQAFSVVDGKEIPYVQSMDVYQSVLISKQGAETFISSIIPLEKITLLFKLDNQKTTFIYVDRSDRSKYYFDVEFLST
jgi:hypothetical protein